MVAKTKKKYRVAVIGATGLVGSTTLSILEERKFPIDELYLIASSRSAGEICEFGGDSYEVQDIEKFDFSRSEICFFCTGNDVAAKYVPLAAKLNNIVIDKSSYFRYHDDVPLVVPEVNAQTLMGQKNIIANPNCTTIP
ncbi:MAG TPA: aspartate-semialdehyde dehydrogenase, partial [Gammaproteobacteria bacterium]|nr:aspartate-semialdehyde dehydrogenase [Gammaproteobacteria bacterium]